VEVRAAVTEAAAMAGRVVVGLVAEGAAAAVTVGGLVAEGAAAAVTVGGWALVSMPLARARA